MATNVRIHDASSGSSSKTRNKIQAILSSFMHEKDDFAKERYAERDITDSPGLLSMLCQPRNRENFYERVETFSPFTWPMKPLYLSPQHCALYGWENTDVDLLTCVSCKATLDGMVGTQWDLDTYNSTCAELRSSIINGHSKFCPWKETPCPESFLSLPAKTPQEWKTSFEDSCKNLLSLEGSLPVLQREAFQALEIPEDVLSILSNSVTDSDSSSYHQDIIDTICVLALCGWNTSNNSGIPVLCCSACHREAGLWNFHPLRNVTVLKNDNAQPCDAEARVTGDDDGHSESQGMPCDAEVGVTGDNDGHSESQGMPCDAEAGVTGDDDGHSTEPQGMMEDDTSDSGSHIQPMDFGKYGGAKRNEETQRESVIMVCDIGIIRDKDSFKTEHYESENDGSKREHAGSQEVTMDSDEYTAGTEGEHKVTLDNLVQVNKKDQEVERLESQSCEENDNLNMESSKMSPLCGNISDEMQDENVVSEPFVCNDNDREISATKVEDSFQNTSDQIESHVESESQTEHSTLAEIRTQMPEQERSTLPSEDISLPQDIVAPEQGAVFRRTEEEPLAEEEHLQDKEPLQEKELSTEKESIRQYDLYEHVTEKDSLSKQEPISHEHAAQQNQRSVLDEDRQLPESDPPVEEEPTVEQGIGKDSEVLSQPDTSGEEMRDVIDIRSQPPGFSENEDATDSDIPSDQGDDEQDPGTSTEPSRLFGAGSFFSPAHSRQDSLIVELGEDSMSERLQSIQSDLLDRGETASQMDSCRSLSEWSEGDVGEPSSKRLKTDGIEQIEFDVLAEHRNWCPWVTAVPSARDTSETVQKSPGWKILLEHLIQFTSPGKQPAAKQLQTPPTQVWKSVRRLFHDCQTTIMRNHMPSKVGR